MGARTTLYMVMSHFLQVNETTGLDKSHLIEMGIEAISRQLQKMSDAWLELRNKAKVTGN